MEIFGCPVCGNIFKESMRENMYIPSYECPIEGCSGKMDEYDHVEFEIAHVLEHKGYHLESICIPESFSYCPSIRLRFRDNYSFTTLPKGFELITFKPKDCIYPVEVVKVLNDSLSRAERYKEIARACIDLMEFAQSLT